MWKVLRSRHEAAAGEPVRLFIELSPGSAFVFPGSAGRQRIGAMGADRVMAHRGGTPSAGIGSCLSAVPQRRTEVRLWQRS